MEQHAAKKYTQELKEKFESLAGSLCITDPSGRMVYANGGISRRTGYDVPEVVGKKPSELWGGHMPRAFYNALWHTIQEKKEPFIGRVVNRKKDGSMHEEVLHIAPVFGGSRDIRYFIEIHPDTRDNGRAIVFQQEFMRHLQTNQVGGSGVVDWVSYWLAGEQVVHPPVPHTGSLFDLLEALFVDPTDDFFSDRKEDAKLIVAAQQDGAAFGALYSKYYHRIFHYFYERVLKQRGVAEDLAQETFLRAFRHVTFFEHKNASYYTYLLRIAHNVLVNFYRKKQVVSFDEQVHDIPAPEVHESMWSHEVVWRAVRSFSPIEQTIFTLRYQEELSIKEIADMLDKTENAIKLHLSRARKKLRDILS